MPAPAESPGQRREGKSFITEHAWVALAFLTLLCLGSSNFLSGVVGKEAAQPSLAGRSNGQLQLLTQGVSGIVMSFAVAISRGTVGFCKDSRSTASLLAAGVVLASGILVMASALASDFKMAPFITGVLPIIAGHGVGFC